MQKSQFIFENKPSKQFPLDNKVWKLNENPTINEEPLFTEESELGYQIEIKRIFNDSRCQQYTNSMIINNYTVHSISQATFNHIDSEFYQDYLTNQWDQYRYQSVLQ
ncbi:unnamed protein product [Paramecium pentaurelia]|uniref:Uncharacterized protein n=1 Tax=Paramecium pentaurelia TaxID=43138 RepID=A0A8S1X7C8_9CILI|nr:unnamed protein product [Paramecium pentaurelia]